MTRPSDINIVEARIGYQFKNWSLLALAITHSSRRHVVGHDNERLEFLGDRVLGLVIAERIMADHPDAPPGDLAVRFNALVSRESCIKAAKSIKLDEVMRVGKSAKKSHHRMTHGIAGNAMEAVIGAVYVDAGLEAAKQAIERLWEPQFSKDNCGDRDPKSLLQIWAQTHQQTPPNYQLVGRTGPDHEPCFTVEVSLQSGEKSTAQGGSKQNAEMQAAKDLLEKIETKNG